MEDNNNQINAVEVFELYQRVIFSKISQKDTTNINYDEDFPYYYYLNNRMFCLSVFIRNMLYDGKTQC